MFLLSRLRAGAPQLFLTFVVFSLASGILGGILFYFDMTTPQVFDEVADDVSVDMRVEVVEPFYQQKNMTLEDIQEIIQSQNLVSEARLVSYLQIYDFTEKGATMNTYLGVDEDALDKFPNAWTYSSDNGPITNSTCWLEAGFMNSQGLSVGDNFTLTINIRENWILQKITLTLKIVGTFTTTLFPTYHYYYPYTEATVGRTTARMLTSWWILNSTFGPNVYYEDGFYRDTFFVKFDRQAIFQQDPTETTTELQNIQRRIEQETLPFTMVPYNGFQLYDAVRSYREWTVSIRLIGIAFSIPTLIMGILLVYYDVNLSADEIRRDVGTIKTRGASGRQAFLWVLSRALVTAFLGVLGAFVVGFLSSYLANTVRTFFEFDFTKLQGIAFLAEPSSLMFVFFFSFFVGLLVAIPISIRALMISATEAHQIIEREVLTGTEKMGSPFVDLVLLGIGVYILTPFLLMAGYISYTTYGFAMFMMFVVPLLAIVIFSFTRLLSRPTSGIKGRVLEKLSKRKYPVALRVIGRTVRLYKKSEAMGVMFIAMVFTAGILSSVAATTGYTHMRDLSMFMTGGDIVVDFKTDAENITNSFVNNITLIQGVASASGIVKTTGVVTYHQVSDWGGEIINKTIPVFGVEPRSWLTSAFWLPYFTLLGSPETSLTSLALDNTSVITSFRPVIDYQGQWPDITPIYSDKIFVRLQGPTWKNDTEAKIIDVLTDSNGYLTYFPGEPYLANFVIMNRNYVQACTNSSRITKVYVKLEPNANYSRIIHEIYSLSPSSIERIQSGLQLIEELLENKAGQTIYGVYTLDVIFTLLFLTIGMVLVSAARVRKLRRSFSILRALGAEPEPIAKSMTVDTLLTVFLAALTGGLLGVVLGFSMSQIPLAFTGVETTANWLRLPVMVRVPEIVLTGILGIAVVAALLASYLVTKTQLKKNIAEEIQYVE